MTRISTKMLILLLVSLCPVTIAQDETQIVNPGCAAGKKFQVASVRLHAKHAGGCARIAQACSVLTFQIVPPFVSPGKIQQAVAPLVTSFHRRGVAFGTKSGDDLFFTINIPQEAVVIPETMDGIRAALSLQKDGDEAVSLTNKYLGME